MAFAARAPRIANPNSGGRRLARALAWLGFLLVLPIGARALESTWLWAVQLRATVQASPPRIELSWPADYLPALSYTVQRKLPSESAWGEPITLPGGATSFVDEQVAPGGVYEYQVTKQGVSYTGYGYIMAGLEAPLIEYRGKLVLVVDSSMAGPLANELGQLERDLAGDGWTVVRRDVARDAAPADVRAAIKAEYDADPQRVRAVLLFGHVPVVRAGNLNVDGHAARPLPADVYYGEMDAEWPDANNDGVLDPGLLPSDVDLQVGRVDFADLPGTYSPVPYPSEVELLRRYLEKDHAYRNAITRPAERALIAGLNDAGGQAYAASGYRSFAPLVGTENIVTLDTDATVGEAERWSARLARDDYLFAFGMGAGSEFTIGGLGTHGQYRDFWASDFVQLQAKAAFYLMFGSWFVDWSGSDNVLRTALASPEYGLAAAWSGRPHIFLHAMGAGETIGYAMRLSQNNDGHLYQNQVQRQVRGVHIALLGDPTLRLYPVAPPTAATATANGADVVIAWTASNDPVLGYHVYRGATPGGPFVRLTTTPLADTRFTDASHANDDATYLVRAIVRQVSPSGTFFNASQGARATFGRGVSRDAAAIPTPPAPAAPSGPADVVWVDDALPPGATAYASANDRWNWVTGEPAPASGALAHCAELAPGLHHHFFAGATTPLVIGAGDVLYAYVFIDPANPPRGLQLTWLADNWEHRAYWGENVWNEGVDGAASRKRMGDLPAAGSWVRLEVPASAVGLEGKSATGMGFTLFDGRASWDRAGKMSAR